MMRPLRADQIQHPDDAARHYAQRAEAGIGRTIDQALSALGTSIDLSTVTRLLESNHFDRLWRHLAIDRLTGALRPALNRLAVVHDQTAIAATAEIAGQAIVKARPSFVRTPDVINLTYDPLNTATVAAQNASNVALTDAVEASTQATAQQVIARGLAQHQSPAAIARNLRDTLGLTQQEANAIQGYRRALESGNASSLSRALRDARYDARVRRGDMTEDQIDTMTSRYAERYRAFRAARLARTASLASANAGRQAAWAQYADRTGREPTDIRKFWLIAGDELVCPVCRAIPQLNPDGIPMDGQYDTPNGPMSAPPDPHPNCRCTERFETIPGTGPAPREGATGAGIRIELDYA